MSSTPIPVPRTPGADAPRTLPERREVETASLLARAHAHPELRDRLQAQAIELNMALARDLAGRYRGRGIADADLQQVAYLGLVKAVRRYDPTRGVGFLGFAVPTIRGE